MNINQLLRKEQVFGTYWFLGDAGFGPYEARPEGDTKLCFLWSADESPFLSSKAYSTYDMWINDQEFAEFVTEFAGLLNDSHRACWHAQLGSRMQPAFWMYPFVRPADYGYLVSDPTSKIDKAAWALLRKTEIGKRFYSAFIVHFLYSAIPLSYRVPRSSNRNFALVNGSVWSSEADLSTDQWLIAVGALEEQKKREIENLFGQMHRTAAPRERIRLSEAVRSEVWRRDMGQCSQCGSNERLEYDHIIALSRGGSDTARNLQLLCENCNRRKGNSI